MPSTIELPERNLLKTWKKAGQKKHPGLPQHGNGKPDSKNKPPRYAPGYPRVAAFMECGGNLAIFKKFNRVAYRSILHQQLQLLKIEREIDMMDAADDELAVLSLRMETSDNKPSSASDTRTDDLRAFIAGSSDGKRESQMIMAQPNQRPSSKMSPLSNHTPAVEALGRQRWIDVSFSMGTHDRILDFRAHATLRGVWDDRPDSPNSVAFSIIFLPDRSGRPKIPIVVCDESFNRAEYSSQASWQFDILSHPPKMGSVPKPRSFVGEDFYGRMAAYIRSTGSYDPSERLTARFFLYYSPRSGNAWKLHAEHGFIVFKNSPLKDLRIEQALSLEKDDLSDPEKVYGIEAFRGFRPQTYPSILKFLAARQLHVMRDGSLMADSIRREDMVRRDALFRLQHELSDYRNALLQHANLAQLQGATGGGLTTLRRWFRGGGSKTEKLEDIPLQGLARDIYTHRDKNDDLVAVGPPTRSDYLSRLIDWTLARSFRDRGVQPMQDLGDIYFYSEKSVENLVSIIGMVLAAGLLIGAIVGLDKLSNKAARLGTICALTVAFALVLYFTTTSTRGEVFGASAAYAAVLVVYVGGALDK